MDDADTMTSAPLLGEPVPVELMNTVWADRNGRHDALNDVDDLTRWLDAMRPRLPSIDGPTGRVPAGGMPNLALVRRFRDLRDALRRLAATVTDDRHGAASSTMSEVTAALRVVNESCAAAPTWSELTWLDDGPPTRGPRSAHAYPEAALSWIAERAVDLFAGPEAADLRACHGPGCVLYFVRDHARREWCSAACGNRARVARHYRRHRTDAPA